PPEGREAAAELGDAMRLSIGALGVGGKAQVQGAQRRGGFRPGYAIAGRPGIAVRELEENQTCRGAAAWSSAGGAQGGGGVECIDPLTDEVGLPPAPSR